VSDWQLGRREVLGLFQVPNYAGFIFTIELTRPDLDELTEVLMSADSPWAQDLHEQILARLKP